MHDLITPKPNTALPQLGDCPLSMADLIGGGSSAMPSFLLLVGGISFRRFVHSAVNSSSTPRLLRRNKCSATIAGWPKIEAAVRHFDAVILGIRDAIGRRVGND